MRHAAHKAAKVSHAQFSLSKALFTANRGSHTAKAVRMAQLAEGGAVVGLAPEVVDKLNEVAPMSRRAMREAAKAASRKSALVTSASLAALVGTAATALVFSQQNASRLVLADDGTETSQIKRVSDGAASRSEGRTALKEQCLICFIESLAYSIPLTRKGARSSVGKLSSEYTGNRPHS